MSARGRPPLPHDYSDDDWDTLTVKLSADNLDTLDRFLTATGQLAVAAAAQLGRDSEAVDLNEYRQTLADHPDLLIELLLAHALAYAERCLSGTEH